MPIEVIDVTVPGGPIAVDPVLITGPAGPVGAPRTVLATAATSASAGVGPKAYFPIFEDTKVVAYGIVNSGVNTYATTGVLQLCGYPVTGGAFTVLDTLTIGAADASTGKLISKSVDVDFLMSVYSLIVLQVGTTMGTSTFGVTWAATEKL